MGFFELYNWGSLWAVMDWDWFLFINFFASRKGILDIMSTIRYWAGHFAQCFRAWPLMSRPQERWVRDEKVAHSFSLIYFVFFYIYSVLWACKCTSELHSLPGDERTSCWSWFSPSTRPVLCLELIASGSVAHAWVQWATSLVHLFLTESVSYFILLQVKIFGGMGVVVEHPDYPTFLPG